MTRNLSIASSLFILMMSWGCDQAPLVDASSTQDGDAHEAQSRGGDSSEEEAQQSDVTSAPRGIGEEDVARAQESDESDTPNTHEEEAPEFLEAILALEGKMVAPQSLLHLTSELADCEGEATHYAWRVAQPEGSVSTFVPHAQDPNPNFEANVAGEYTFELDSFDESDNRCAPTHRFMVSVTPDSALHIELLWHTPQDPDESDEGPEAGADLDLHFTHNWPEAKTEWFDQPFDCFWFNAHPNWGSLDPSVSDDPSLDRDDTDGAGPENLNLNLSEEGISYGVMVHYWHDHGFGESLATIRVYVQGTLTYEKKAIVLKANDAWEVGSLDDQFNFTPKVDDQGEPVIIHDFEHLFGSAEE